METKKYQVFVSSTYEDLIDERKEVMQALLELPCIPSGMELFPAADDDQWTLIKRVIDDCDYYIVIIGGRYGSVSPDGVSYTQMEYEYAASQGKPILGFIHKRPGAIASEKTEASEEGRAKLDTFRKVVEKKMCKYWTTPVELGSVVSRSLSTLIYTKPAIGWVRANTVAEAASQEILNLKKQIESLELLLERARLEAPKGTDELAQGNDTFEIKYSYQFRTLADQSIGNTDTIILSWNNIFAAIAPYLIENATEDSLKTALDNYVLQAKTLELWKKHREMRELNSLKIMDDDFQTIKVQLRALGLITMYEQSKSSRDIVSWTLTPYGDHMLTTLRAIKKAERVNAEANV
jgi:hypothetical protein